MSFLPPCNDSGAETPEMLESCEYSCEANCTQSDNEPSIEDMEFTDSYEAENGLVIYTIVFLLQLQTVHAISDTAIDAILKFLKKMFVMLSDASRGISVEKFSQMFPSTMYSARKRVNVCRKSIKEFPVCPGCKYVYHLEECIESCGSLWQAKRCKRKIGHSVCNSDIVTAKPTLSGQIFAPIQTFCYNPIGDSLTLRVCNDVSFLNSCEKWRENSQMREQKPDYCDVFDGAVWKSFESFLQSPNTLLLQLNVDWFQPFEHVVHSVGVMYVTVLNLPSFERYKMKNVFLVGLIPGPDEPKHDINYFLRPFVDELLTLWEQGISVKSPTGRVTVKCALACVACDIPAARKVSGFIGHSGRLGCSKCKKEFKSISGVSGKQVIRV